MNDNEVEVGEAGGGIMWSRARGRRRLELSDVSAAWVPMLRDLTMVGLVRLPYLAS